MSAPTLSAAFGGSLAAAVLLTQFGILRTQIVGDQIRLFAFQSFLTTLLTVGAGISLGGADLYILAALNLALKTIVIPLLLRALVAQLGDVSIAVPLAVGTPRILLVGAALTALAYLTTSRLQLSGAFLPQSALAVAVAVVLLSFWQMATHLNGLSQLVAFLTLDDGIYFGSVAIAPGLPLVLAILIFFPLLIAVIAFAVLVRLLGRRGATVAVDRLTELQG